MKHIFFTLSAFLLFIPSVTASPIIKELPKEKKGKVKLTPVKPVDELPPEKDKKQTDNFSKPILRNYLSLSAGYSELYHNGIKNAAGGSLFLDAIAFFRIRRISLFSTLTLNFNSLASELFNATETFTLLNTSLMVRSRFRTTPKANHYITYGTAFIFHHESLKYDGAEAFKQRYGIGPSVGYMLESRYCDFHLGFSALWGEKSSSYDVKRNIIVQNLRVGVTPRYWRFSLPMHFEAIHWINADKVVDRYNIDLKASLGLEYRVTKEVTLFYRGSYTYRMGEDFFHLIDHMLGGKITW